MRIHSRPPVPMVFSAPANSHQMSFLKLPAEIRDMIYTFVLGEAATFVVYDLRRRIANSETYLRRDFRMLISDYKYLLLSCRQVYHEIGSLLFGAKTFEFFSRSKPYLEQGSKAGSWMLGMQNQAHILRKIVLNFDGSGVPLNYSASRSWIPFEFGSGMSLFELLKAFWTLAAPNLEVSFVHPGLEDDNATVTSVDVLALADLFQKLREDQLDVQKYMPLISEIFVKRDGLGGTVVWKTTRSREICDRRDFRVCFRSGKLVFLEKPKPSLLTMPPEIKESIYSYISCPEKRVKVELDRGAYFGANPVLLSVSRQVRKDNDLLFWHYKDFEIISRSSELRTSFCNFSALKKWLHCPNPLDPLNSDNTSKYPFYPRSDFRDSRLTVVLAWACFETHVGLEDIRVSIMDLIRYTSHVSGSCAIRFVLGTTKRYEISLTSLRENVSITLAKIALKQPNSEQLQCPNVWVNGRGEVTGATLSSSAVLNDLDSDSTELWDTSLSIDNEWILVHEYGKGVEWTEEGEEDIESKQRYYAIPIPVERYYDGRLGHMLGFLRKILLYQKEEWWAQSYFVLPEPSTES